MKRKYSVKGKGGGRKAYNKEKAKESKSERNKEDTTKMLWG